MANPELIYHRITCHQKNKQVLQPDPAAEKSELAINYIINIANYNSGS
jgi:hypothetical protein